MQTMTSPTAQAEQLVKQLVCDMNEVLWERYGHCKVEVALVEHALRQAQAETLSEVKVSYLCACSPRHFEEWLAERAKAAERENAVVEGIEADCNTAAGEP